MLTCSEEEEEEEDEEEEEEEEEISLKADKNNRYSTPTHVYFYDNTTLNCFRQKL
jgi:hypothetical protein